MENPASWTLAEWVICDAYEEWHRITATGVYGPSVARFIADALRDRGLLPTDLLALRTFESPL